MILRGYQEMPEKGSNDNALKLREYSNQNGYILEDAMHALQNCGRYVEKEWKNDQHVDIYRNDCRTPKLEVDDQVSRSR